MLKYTKWFAKERGKSNHTFEIIFYFSTWTKVNFQKRSILSLIFRTLWSFQRNPLTLIYFKKIYLKNSTNGWAKNPTELINLISKKWKNHDDEMSLEMRSLNEELNSIPCSCKTEGPIFLLAVSRVCSQFLETARILHHGGFSICKDSGRKFLSCQILFMFQFSLTSSIFDI